MLAEYEDIRSRIAEAPQWFDSHGVPRYAAFHPKLSPNIYARQVVLLEIACQSCGERFRVEMHSCHMDQVMKRPTLIEAIEGEFIHYGDPPIHGDGCAGNTMNCEDLRVLEFWKRDRFDWVRVPELERDLPDLAEIDG